MCNLLTKPQREQAGSDSYNRFEYQVHWIVCHIIEKLDDNKECVVLCEYVDDVTDYFPNDEQCDFFQIKTKDDYSDWTIAEMSKKVKSSKGDYKKSFLGFIFYNFLSYGQECNCCYFVSNVGFDKEVRTWQAYIEDGKQLKLADIELYKKIKQRISDEYKNDNIENFDAVFDKFIQNTFVIKSDLQLSTYVDQTKGKFFDQLVSKDIKTNVANAIFQQLLEDVRRKSKQKTDVSISQKKLIESKGIDIAQIEKKIDGDIQNSGNYHDFFQWLDKKLEKTDSDRIKSAKILHDMRKMNMDDLKYQKTVSIIEAQVIKAQMYSSFDRIGIQYLKNTCYEKLEQENLISYTLDESLIEVIYYEKEFIRAN